MNFEFDFTSLANVEDGEVVVLEVKRYKTRPGEICKIFDSREMLNFSAIVAGQHWPHIRTFLGTNSALTSDLQLYILCKSSRFCFWRQHVSQGSTKNNFWTKLYPI